MAAINTRNVHRSNQLRGGAYGADFVYDEMMLTGLGEKGEQTARAIAAAVNDMANEKGPKPGDGPSRAEQESGFYDLLFVGYGPDSQRLDVSVKGDRDPGYGSTSKMIGESAIALLEDCAGVGGGVMTPAAGSSVKQEITLQQGISVEKAREIVKVIKDSKKKVQASIQGDLVRVSSKDRDTLQEIIQLLRQTDFGIDVQFTNYRSN